MTSFFLSRLALDAIAACLLLFGLSYWWLGNTAHEIAGTAMFVLVIAHNVFNRRWYGHFGDRERRVRGLISTALTLALLAAMLVLLVTSVLISNTLAGVMSAFGGFTVRQIHTVSAYWVLVLVAVHLGLRWPMLMGVARTLSGITRASPARATLMRVLAGLIAACGIWSAGELGVWSKLTMEMTLDWWNFEESVAGFFLHGAAVAGLAMVVTYYAMAWLRPRRAARATSPNLET